MGYHMIKKDGVRMKKYILMSVIAFSVLSAGCSDDQSKKVEAEDKVAAESNVEQTNIEESDEEVESVSSFENGVLDTPMFTMSIKSAELIQSQGYDKKGLFVTYELVNKTDDSDIVPANLFQHFKATQENETSRVELPNDYLYLDAFGDERYNEMVDKDNSSNNVLLPGKTVEIYDAYTLDNSDEPVMFYVNDVDTDELLGEYEVKLK